MTHFEINLAIYVMVLYMCDIIIYLYSRKINGLKDFQNFSKELNFFENYEKQRSTKFPEKLDSEVSRIKNFQKSLIEMN